MSSSGDASNTRGAGFVHLNTPAAIHYTAGQTLSLSTLRQRRSRVECVTLPESQAVWRRAFQRYLKEEGYGSYAADVEDERDGNGAILPSLAPQRSGPQRRRAGEVASSRDAFFCGVAPRTDETAATAFAAPASASPAAEVSGGGANATQAACSSASSALPSSVAGGIRIVSHHKIAGRQQFVYPDHDGVLSAGIVPEVVVTAEEKAEEEAAKAFYISALDMSEEELAALEELQALWKNRARSHSFLGAQHRNAAKGSADPLSDGTVHNTHAGSDGPALKSRRVEGKHGEGDVAVFAEAETAVDDASTLDKELAEALRLADELLRFA